MTRFISIVLTNITLLPLSFAHAAPCAQIDTVAARFATELGSAFEMSAADVASLQAGILPGLRETCAEEKWNEKGLACLAGGKKSLADCKKKLDPSHAQSMDRIVKAVMMPAKEVPKALPTTNSTLRLDTGGGAIPATVEVPEGSTVFWDDTTTVRVSWDQGELFGIKIAAANEFNSNLAEVAEGMRENKYGMTNEILEQSESYLRFTMKREGQAPDHKFRVVIALEGSSWVCSEGNWGGWTAEQSERQIAACKTLAAAEAAEGSRSPLTRAPM